MGVDVSGDGNFGALNYQILDIYYIIIFVIFLILLNFQILKMESLSGCGCKWGWQL